METPDRDDVTERDRERAGNGARSGQRQPLTPDLELREIRKGSKPGSRYVRLTPRSKQAFRRVGEAYQATDIAIRPRNTAERVWRQFKRIVVGAPLASSQLLGERLSKLKAIAIFGSDNLSSSAYATEEMLLVLILAGTAALTWSIPIALAIVGLVVIVGLSYSQVIRGYPDGGGAYVVAKQNLGLWAGYVAGASLIANYVVLVAVSIAAGVAAIGSAVPELHDHRIIIAVSFAVLLTLANLRGIRESGSLFALPTYLFIITFSGLLITGLVRLALGHDLTVEAPEEQIELGTQTVTFVLILRAFSSGSAALTGIEAVSNGVPTLRPPEARNAVVVLFWMVLLLGSFFVGTTILAHQLDVVPSETKTVIAQIAEEVVGTGPLFYTVQITTMLILILAANTSFAGLPSLASVMARDRVLPRQFAFRGDRLAFSNGIMVLGAASIGLLIVFRADTHELIPLYALGVFVGFTLAQLGLVRHWARENSVSARVSLAINFAGAVITGVVTVIVAATKFVDGAWITIAGIVLLVFFFWRIYSHYQSVNKQLAVERADPELPAAAETGDRPQRGQPVVVPVDELNRAVLRTLDYALTVSKNVTAVHVTDDVEQGEHLRGQWEEIVPDTPLVIVESPYRSLLAPMLAYIDAIDAADPGSSITVVLPEFVPAHFWEGLLHNQASQRLKRALLHRPNTVLIDVPYHLE